MFLKELELENFGPHKSLQLEFERGLNGIYGRNGSGKSSAIGAAYAALTGDWSRHVLGKTGCIRQGADSCSVSLCLDLGGDDNTATIKRVLVPKSSQLLKFHDLEIRKSDEIAEWLSHSLFITRHLIDNYMFVPQGEMYSFLDVSPRIRADRFSQLCGTEIAEKIRDTVLRSYKTESDDLLRQSDLADSNALNNELKKIENDLNEAKKTHKELNKKLNACVSLEEYREISNRYCQIDDIIKEWNLHGWDIKGLRKDREDFEESLSLSTKQRDLLLGQMIGIDSNVEQGYVNCLNTDQVNKALNLQNRNSVNSFNELTKELSSIQQRMKNISEAPRMKFNDLVAFNSSYSYAVPETLREKYHAMKQEIRNAQQLLDIGQANGGVCPTCHTSSEHWSISSGELLKSVTENTALLEKIDAAATEYEESLKTYNGLVSTSENIKNQLELLKCNTNSSLLPELDESQVTEIQNWLQWYRTAKTEIDKLEHQIYAAKSNLKGVDNTIELYEAQNLKYKAALREKEVVCKKFEDASKSNNDRLQLSVDIGEYKAKIDNLQERREEQQKKIIKEEEKAKNYAKAGKFVNLLDRSLKVLHRDNLPRAIHMKVLQSMLEKINDELVSFEAPFSVTAEDDLSFVAHFSNGVSITAGALSGGQKVLLGFAYWFALQALFAKQIGVMILDEPTDGLDKYNREKSIDVLQALKSKVLSKGQQVIIITHDDMLMSVFNKIHIIGKETHYEV